LSDFVDRSIVSLKNVEYLVLDEADRMLDMGFEPQIRRLVIQSGMKSKGDGRKTLMFSATFPSEIQLLAREFLRPSYTWIAVGRVGSTNDSITQILVQAKSDKRRKLRLVMDAIVDGPKGRTLIFVQKKRSATWLKKMLGKGGPGDDTSFQHFKPIRAVEIHGDRSQSQREAALKSFRSGECKILVATDVAARGLDISGIEHVINMDLPTSTKDFDSYVHRIGRTGRAGHIGLATSLYVPGKELKVGNGPIAKMMVEQLVTAKQDVPEWLGAEVRSSYSSSSSNDGNRDQYTKHKRKFGGINARNKSGGRGSNNNARRGSNTVGSRSRPKNGPKNV